MLAANMVGTAQRAFAHPTHAARQAHPSRARPHEFLQQLQGDSTCPASPRKIFRFRRRANHLYPLAPSRPTRGAYRDRHGRWCGMRWTQQRRARKQSQGGFSRERSARARRTALLRTAKPCGPGTRCWCQADGDAPTQPGAGAVINPSATVTRRIRRRGEHGISRKTIAQGTPECSVCTCMLVCAFPCASCTRDRGCSVHPAFPAPSDFEGEICKPRAYRAART